MINFRQKIPELKKMKKPYKVIKTVNGNRTANVIGQFDNIEAARKCLIEVMASFDKGSDTHFVSDEESRQSEIELLNELAEENGTDVSALIDKINLWAVPCLIDLPSHEEICNADGDRFSYDNCTVEIVTPLRRQHRHPTTHARRPQKITKREMAEVLSRYDICGLYRMTVYQICKKYTWQELKDLYDDLYEALSEHYDNQNI